jgi:hypothetical protein
MIEFFTAAAECDPGVTWPHVASFGILILGIVGVAWAVNR